MTKETECIYGNGIYLDTGEYITKQIGIDDVLKGSQNTSLVEIEPHDYRVGFDVDVKKLSETGWGVIFPQGYEAEQTALEKLLRYREAQTRQGNGKALFKVFTYGHNWKKSDFLAAYGAEGLGFVKPELIPYYLLIVASPEEIPFSFQYQLAVQYAVGRIHFDNLNDYEQYADNIIQGEALRRQPPFNLTFFGAKTPGDMVSHLGVKELVEPLAERFKDFEGKWKVRKIIDREASKAKLVELLSGDDTPSLLFTEGHGLATPSTYKDQKKYQGALVCSDWPGGCKPRAEHFFAASDLDELKDANLLGLITFHFACYSVGTPRLSDYSHDENKDSNVIAQEAFISSLAKKLLGRPNGALAAIGHVERAWIHSFIIRDQSVSQTHCFEGTLKLLMQGYPVGAALEALTSRYADLACRLTDDLEQVKTQGKAADPNMLWWWTAHNDARAYAIIGDPATRLYWADADAPPALPPTDSVMIASVNQDTTANRSESESVSSALDQTTTGLGQVTTTDTSKTTIEVEESTERGEKEQWPNSAIKHRERSRQQAIPAGSAGASLGSSVSSATASSLVDAPVGLPERLRRLLEKAINDAATLEVKTYVSDDLPGVNLQTIEFEQSARLRAVTRIRLDGDVETYVPVKSGELDGRLWEAHKEMVAQAQAYRTEMLKTMVSVAAGLLAACKES